MEVRAKLVRQNAQEESSNAQLQLEAKRDRKKVALLPYTENYLSCTVIVPVAAEGQEPLRLKLYAVGAECSLLGTTQINKSYRIASVFSGDFVIAKHTTRPPESGVLYRRFFVTQLQPVWICELSSGTPVGYSTHLWDCVYHMSEALLETCRVSVEGATVVELGSGCGLGAIAASLAGARKVLATEIEGKGFDLLRANLCLNGAKVDSLPLLWENRLQLDSVVEWLQQNTGRDSVLLAADVLYNSRYYSELARVLFRILDAFPSTRCYVFYKCRNQQERQVVNVFSENQLKLTNLNGSLQSAFELNRVSLFLVSCQ